MFFFRHSGWQGKVFGVKSAQDKVELVSDMLLHFKFFLSFFAWIYLFYVWMLCLHDCMCTMYILDVCSSERGVVSHQCGSWDSNPGPCKSNSPVNSWATRAATISHSHQSLLIQLLSRKFCLQISDFTHCPVSSMCRVLCWQ